MQIGLNIVEMQLYTVDRELLVLAEEIALKYGFVLVEEEPDGVEAFLKLDSEGLVLVTVSGNKDMMKVDYLRGRSGYRLSTINNTSQPVLKAVGFNKDRMGLRILDVTAGLGVDGVLMATAGCRVTLLERSSVMVALLEDGFRRVAESEDESVLQDVFRERIELFHVDSMQYLKKTSDLQYDVIYVDPMFPQRQKSSKVKKEMQLAKLFTGDEDNALELLDAALSTSVRRVVLKRPLKAPILKKGFSSQIKGKSIRFDVYVR